MVSSSGRVPKREIKKEAEASFHQCGKYNDLHCGLEDHAVSFVGVFAQLVEVQVAVSIHCRFVDLFHIAQILCWRRYTAQQRRYGSQRCGGQVDVSAIPQAIREVTG